MKYFARGRLIFTDFLFCLSRKYLANFWLKLDLTDPVPANFLQFLISVLNFSFSDWAYIRYNLMSFQLFQCTMYMLFWMYNCITRKPCVRWEVSFKDEQLIIALNPTKHQSGFKVARFLKMAQWKCLFIYSVPESVRLPWVGACYASRFLSKFFYLYFS